MQTAIARKEQDAVLANIRGLMEATLESARQYEHSYGQAREEALADYGNKFNATMAAISKVVKSSEPIATPDEYAQYYHGAMLNGLKPFTFAEYQVECAKLGVRALHGK